MGNKEEKNNTVPNGSMEITGRRHKSARPGRISYVPISDEDLAPYEPPVRKKHKDYRNRSGNGYCKCRSRICRYVILLFG